MSIAPAYRDRLIAIMEKELGERFPRLAVPYRHGERRSIAAAAVQILVEEGAIFQAAAGDA